MNETSAQVAAAPPSLVFERLLLRYERRCGETLPARSMDIEEANRFMREALATAPNRDMPEPRQNSRRQGMP